MTVFGDPNGIAIEVGECIENYGGDGPYVQFRFIVNGKPIGDWDDRIPLLGSIERAMDFYSSKPNRQNDTLRELPSEEFFDRTYDAFYSGDYAPRSNSIPNLRDRHQLSEIGMSALSDKVGISVADFSNGQTRIVARDLRSGNFLLDTLVESNVLDAACEGFIQWTKERFAIET